MKYTPEVEPPAEIHVGADFQAPAQTLPSKCRKSRNCRRTEAPGRQHVADAVEIMTQRCSDNATRASV